jgi:hypothetical protein
VHGVAGITPVEDDLSAAEGASSRAGKNATNVFGRNAGKELPVHARSLEPWKPDVHCGYELGSAAEASPSWRIEEPPAELENAIELGEKRSSELCFEPAARRGSVRPNDAVYRDEIENEPVGATTRAHRTAYKTADARTNGHDAAFGA